MSPDDWVMCDCAGCGAELFARHMRAFLVHLPPEAWFVSGHILGRPYCAACLHVRPPGERSAAPAGGDDDGGPWQQNAVRDLEGD